MARSRIAKQFSEDSFVLEALGSPVDHVLTNYADQNPVWIRFDEPTPKAKRFAAAMGKATGRRVDVRIRWMPAARMRRIA